MNKKIHLKPFVFSLPLFLIIFLIAIPRCLMYETIPENLSLAIILDLLITVPIMYFIIIRKRNIPKFTTIYPFLLGIVIASYIIPPEHQYILSQIKSIVIPLLEVTAISILLFKIKALNTSFKKTAGLDFYDKLIMATDEIFPNRIGPVLASEMAVFYYLFSFNKKDINPELEFSNYKKSGIISVIGVFIFLLIVETFAVHVLLASWNNTAAWILTILSLYALIQIISILRSMKQRPLFFNNQTQTLHLNYGFASYTRIPYSHIESIEVTRRSPTNDKSHISLSIFDLLDSSNLIISVNQENILYKMYGMKKPFQSIALFVDEKEIFAVKLNEIIARNKAK